MEIVIYVLFTILYRRLHNAECRCPQWTPHIRPYIGSIFIIDDDDDFPRLSAQTRA